MNDRFGQRRARRSRTRDLWICASLMVSLQTARAHAALPGESSVYGGEATAPCSWPTTVFLGGCSGTLIHPEVVMYASHCGDEIPEIHFGEDYLNPDAPGDGFSVATDYCMVNPEAETAVGIGEFRAADFAFCKLVRPVLEVPIVPPLVGCETTVLVPGQAVTLVGFGRDESDTFGIKREVTTILHYIDDFGVAVIGGNGKSSCNGDSGGPAFVQLPDGSWRVFGIVSGPNGGSCGDPSWYPTSFLAVPFIEQETGIDVTPCHYATGEWNPSPACRDFPLAPEDGSGKAWRDGCGGGPTTSWGSACGPAFDTTDDLAAPTAAILEPADRTRVDTEADQEAYALTVRAQAQDDISGVQHLGLVINGAIIEGGQRRSPPWEWNILLSSGVWELRVAATDWVGNTAESPVVVIGVNEDPPVAPDPSTSTGTGDEPASSSSGAADETGVGTSTSTTSTGSDTSDGTALQTDDGGCGCRNSGTQNVGLGLLLAFGAIRRRRMLRSPRGCVTAVALMSACASDSNGVPNGGSATEGATTGATTGTTTADAESVSTSSSSGGEHETSSTTNAGSTGPGCEPGIEGCHCADGFSCNTDLTCLLDTCVPCETGSFACPCARGSEKTEGTCDEGLLCFGGLCAAPQPCPFTEDGDCDEPRGSGNCFEGTDSFDCCATQPDVCEERSADGACPDGADPQDCAGESSSEGSSTEGSSTGAGTG